ncbi:MAG: BON domain-containing protein [Verrucomicrobiia bacterium]
MKTLFVLIVLIGLALGGYWYLSKESDKSHLQRAEEKALKSAQDLKEAVQDKLKDLKLSGPEVKEELQKSGQVVRKKAEQVGAVIADAAADAQITAAIKAKLVKERNLSALRISVNTTDGVVTLSGSVDSAEEISQAMKIALETDGVREAISTLQVKASK